MNKETERKVLRVMHLIIFILACMYAIKCLLSGEITGPGYGYVNIESNPVSYWIILFLFFFVSFRSLNYFLKSSSSD